VLDCTNVSNTDFLDINNHISWLLWQCSKNVTS